MAATRSSGVGGTRAAGAYARTMSQRGERERVLAEQERAAAARERRRAGEHDVNELLHLRAADMHDAAVDVHERAAMLADEHQEHVELAAARHPRHDDA